MMKLERALTTIFVCVFVHILTWTSLVCNAGVIDDKPNVLFIVVDDLRASLGCYGGPIFSPNIDQLAAQSAVFTNAMVQQSLCAPSRTSFLTGRRPDITKLYDFGSYWRTTAGNYTTLPQHFKESGYFAASVGKVFHPGVTCGNNDDMPYSWSIPAYHPSSEQYKNAKVCQNLDGTLHANIMCPVNVTKMPEKTLPDLQAFDRAAEILKSLSMAKMRQDSGNAHTIHPDVMKPPFFLAVGYRKPHIPWKYPKEFQSLYSLESVAIASNPNIPEKLPSVAWDDYHAMRLKEDIRALNLSFPYGTIPLEYHAQMRQNYYASASFTDYQVGRLLQALEDAGFANNTIVLFVGDHGWQLGEHGEWCKFSNFELATRVPLIIHVPGITDTKWTFPKKFSLKDPFALKQKMMSDIKKTNNLERSEHTTNSKDFKRNGVDVGEFVELVDIFPSLSDLAGLSVPSVCPPKSFKVDFCVEGFSFASLISASNSVEQTDARPFKRWKNATFSQYPRPGMIPGKHSDIPHLANITIMGYSMRTKDHHYTEWIGFNHTTFEGDWSDIKARELYIIGTDPQENNNVADEAIHKDLVQTLSEQLLRGWRDCLPVLQ